MEKEFLLSDVVEILDIKESLISQWINRGLVKASKPASGSGSRNIFSIEDICRIELFRELISLGFTRQGASYVAFGMHPIQPNDLITISIKKVLIQKDLQPVLIAICKAEKYGKHASVATSFVKSNKDGSILIEGVGTGTLGESTIFHIINFTKILLKIALKIRKMREGAEI